MFYKRAAILKATITTTDHWLVIDDAAPVTGTMLCAGVEGTGVVGTAPVERMTTGVVATPTDDGDEITPPGRVTGVELPVGIDMVVFWNIADVVVATTEVLLLVCVRGAGKRSAHDAGMAFGGLIPSAAKTTSS
jgi:hypothetical protein